jgi:hypothetical protein
MTEPTRSELELIALQHLNWLEHYTDKNPSLLVANVNILRSFGYDLIQLINHEYLKARLAQ